MGKPNHLLWIVTRAFPPEDGGVQTYAWSIARTYSRLGWTVKVFTTTRSGPRRSFDDRVEVIDVGPGTKREVYWRLFTTMVRARLAGDRPAVIHACTWRSALPAMPFRSAPTIVTVHGREIGRPQGLALRLMRFVLSRASRIVAVSVCTRDLLAERLPALGERIIVAWNGPSALVDGLAPNKPAAEPTILSLCRLVPRKNIRRAVIAAAVCRDGGAAFHYDVAGNGLQTLAVRHEIAERGLGDVVQLHGFVSTERAAELYAQAEIFLHPQISLEDGAEIEGFGIAVADAMVAGAACIVGRDGGPAELIEDGVTGLVVDGNSTESIAAAIDLLIRDGEYRRQLADNGRKWAQANLSWKVHCSRCLAGLVVQPVNTPEDRMAFDVAERTAAVVE